jgi:hypothetical protein
VGVVFRGHREGPLLKKQAGRGENPDGGQSTKDLKSGSEILVCALDLKRMRRAKTSGKTEGALARLIRFRSPIRPAPSGRVCCF